MRSSSFLEGTNKVVWLTYVAPLALTLGLSSLKSVPSACYWVVFKRTLQKIQAPQGKGGWKAIPPDIFVNQ